MRYFFNLEDGTCLRDEDGEELVDDNAATVVARKIAQELGRNSSSMEELVVVVRDQSDRVVATIRVWPEKREGSDRGEQSLP